MSGAVLLMAGGCCCGIPGCCGVMQPDLAVTVAGSCDAGCEHAEGTYTCTDAGVNDVQKLCYWEWTSPARDAPCVDEQGFWVFTLMYNYQTETWVSGYLEYICPTSGQELLYSPPNAYPLSCDADGHLNGIIVIPGANAPSGDCTGCTATVTLGG